MILKPNLEKIKPSGTKYSAKNMYRTRWSLPLGTVNISSTDNTLNVKPEILRVIKKFSGGMVYAVKGQKFVLNEYVIDGYPFLAVFRVEENKLRTLPEEEIFGIPSAIKGQIEVASQNLIQNIKVPDNLHNTEIEVTEPMAKAMNLKDDWSLVKVVFKIPMKGWNMCDCDVDGPCGYCCDTCDDKPCDSHELPNAIDGSIVVRDLEGREKVLTGRLVNLPKLGDSVFM